MFHLVLWAIWLSVLGALAFPIAYPIFRSLPDRGYAFARTLGLLFGAYLLWLLGVLDLFPNNPPAMAMALVPFVLASLFAYSRQKAEIREFVAREWRTIRTTEIVFFVAFLGFALFRSLSPDIHLLTAQTVTTEQPMDLMLLSSTMRSPSYPPLDAWMSGQSISYYYFGYLSLGWLGRLAAAAPPLTYNLGLITIFALGATGAFGVVSNAVRLSLGNGERAVRVSVVGGVLGAGLVLAWGNLVGFLAIVNGWGVGTEGFWRWLNVPGMARAATDGRLIPADTTWWWRPSRVIVDGVGADPINEFPAFSFVLGDLHPHVMSIPFVLAAVAVALAVFARPDLLGRAWLMRRPWEALVVAVVLGALGFVNSWDFPTYGGLFVAALSVRHAHARGAPRGQPLLDATVAGGVTMLLALVLFLPFYATFDSQVNGVLPVAISGTRYLHYVLLWGPFLAIIGLFAAANAFTRALPLPAWGFRLGLVAAIGPLALWTVAMAALSLVTSDPVPAILQPLAGVIATARDRGIILAAGDLPGAFAQRWALVIPLAILIFVAVAALARLGASEERRGWAFGLMLAVWGLLLAMAPELFFVLDLFGTRMNTIFKLHYQAWLLLGLSSAIGASWLWYVWVPENVAWSRVRMVWRPVAVALVVAGGTYAVVAPITRAASSQTGPTLDGLAFYRQSAPLEAEAVTWLERRATPGAVLVEAQGNDYSDSGRVSAITGLPTPLGWLGHEQQWGRDYGDLVRVREDVDSIYSSDDGDVVRSLLDKYNVSYIFAGRLEREKYGGDVVSRLSKVMPLVYQNDEVTIFGSPS